LADPQDTENATDRKSDGDDVRQARLKAAAARALAEAEERREAAAGPVLPPELGGRDGPEPVRYGDYELNGLAVDF